MDLSKIIEELRRDKEKLECVIASVEALQAPSVEGNVPPQKRRGRKFMSPEERRQVSARMKRYWAKRLSSH